MTVQHRSFTVMLTFFFHDGRIHCLLNSLLKMNLEDYDAAGTARMVVTNLQETLGLTRTQLARKLLHFRWGYVIQKLYAEAMLIADTSLRNSLSATH